MSGQGAIKGLILRNGVWHIQKRIGARRIRESTGTGDIREAERYLVHRLEEIRKASIYGIRPTRIWRDAATKYLLEARKRSLENDARQLEMLDPFIGDLPLQGVHIGALGPFIQARREAGMKNRTVNYGLQTVRHILNLAASEWMDEYGLTWLEHAPKIKLLKEDDKREPRPLSWDEQDRLFAEFPEYLRRMALFAVNTGCRDQVICGLRWEWETPIPALETSVFIVPHMQQGVKNGRDFVVVLNSVARAVIESQRGMHPKFVFVNTQGNQVQRMRSLLYKAKKRAGVPDVRIHDLKHTYGRRLRAAGVSFEDRQDLLGHKSSRVTTHYSAPELLNLIRAAESVVGGHKKDTMVILRKRNLALIAGKRG